MKRSSVWIGWHRRAPADGAEAPPRPLGTTPYRTAPPRGLEDEEGDTATGDGTIVGVLVFVLLCALLRLWPLARGHERLGLNPSLALLISLVSGYHLVRAIRRWHGRRRE